MSYQPLDSQPTSRKPIKPRSLLTMHPNPLESQHINNYLFWPEAREHIIMSLWTMEIKLIALIDIEHMTPELG